MFTNETKTHSLTACGYCSSAQHQANRTHENIGKDIDNPALTVSTLTQHSETIHVTSIYSLKPANATTELCPPKPKEFEIPAVMSCCCFSLGTVLMPSTSSTRLSCNLYTQFVHTTCHVNMYQYPLAGTFVACGDG